MGGNNDEDNLIDLYAREHFIAHRLLALKNPENDKLTYAWWCMSVQTNQYTKGRYKITAEEYEEAKIAYANKLSERMSGNNNPMHGISPQERMSNDTYIVWLSKISEKSSGENNPMYGKHHSEQTKEKIRKKLTGNMIGEKNPFYGKRHSETTKEYLKQINTGKKASKETKELMSKMRTGKNNPKAHPLYCYELDEYFWGATDVKNKYAYIPTTNISLAYKNPNRTCGKHPITNQPLHWKSITMEEYDTYIENLKQKEID
jgi:hypothetical protein